MIDEALLARLVAAAEARVGEERSARGHPLTLLSAEILAGHAVQGELEVVGRERAAAGTGGLSAEESAGLLASAMGVLVGQLAKAAVA